MKIVALSFILCTIIANTVCQAVAKNFIFVYLTVTSQKPSEVGTVITSILHMRKLKHREGK